MLCDTLPYEAPRATAGSEAVSGTFSQHWRSQAILRKGRGDLVVLVALAGLMLFAAVLPSRAAVLDAALVRRGRYLAIAGDCVSCHTRAEGKPFAGGLAFHTPFGTVYSPNITPDRQTGIGVVVLQ